MSDCINPICSARQAGMCLNDLDGVKCYGYEPPKTNAEERQQAEKNKQELRVGDCVIDRSGNRCMITNIDRHVHVIYRNGKTHKWNKSDHFEKYGLTVGFGGWLECLGEA